MSDMKRDDSGVQDSAVTVNLTEIAQGLRQRLLDPRRPTALVDYREQAALLSSI